MYFVDLVMYIGDEQACFRSGCSTMDHVFVQNSIIDEKKACYCSFIDYKKAFDLVSVSVDILA